MNNTIKKDVVTVKAIALTKYHLEALEVFCLGEPVDKGGFYIAVKEFRNITSARSYLLKLAKEYYDSPVERAEYYDGLSLNIADCVANIFVNGKRHWDYI